MIAKGLGAACAGAALLMTPYTPAVAPAAAEGPPSVPGSLVITRDGDRYGYAKVPRPYTQRRAQRLTGVLLSLDPVTGRHRTCGAAVLRSPRRDLAVTAAHCLFYNHGAERRWFERVTFVPAYGAAHKGDIPYGVWRAARLWVPRQWRTRPYSTEVLPYDIGLVRLAPGPEGKRLEDVTGRGLRPYPTHRGQPLLGLDLLGYPSEAGYTGDDLYRCTGDATESGGEGPGMLITRNCQIVAGHSGGPAVHDGMIAGVASSSNPYAAPNGYSLITRIPRDLAGHG
ncbi:hypothetical protein HNP84_002749 [Thermocatellispora tengchongensis]|uniref:Serine protease n=1 Tax=Thermocatellispora tengchongensis TaxID=1073253 RepID=A0A840NZW9_9ACTN|nr:hypothetical protein [Thermocatellispora tengchongensis]MBB5133028.1 hypothetical protein [Thermocatellispora tengchongensis]